MANGNLKRFYPKHDAAKPVDPNALNTNIRFMLDHVYDVQSAIGEMTGGATAFATVSGGIVTGATVMFPGFGYSSVQATIEGDGSGAEVEAIIAKGRIVSLKVKNGGTGYTFANVVFDS